MSRFLPVILILLLTNISFGATRAHTGDIQFIPNAGQWTEPYLYRTAVYGGQLFLERNGFTWHFSNASELGHIKHSGAHTEPDDFVVKRHAFKAVFEGADPMTQVSGEDAFSNYYNYFLGNDPARWKGKVPAFGTVHYKGLYPGIDLKVYSRSNSMKYDLIVEPGASAEMISIRYDGLDDMRIVDGNLELITSINKVVEMAPVAWQMIQGEKIEVPCAFRLEGNRIQFSFPQGYDKRYALTIDPATLIFASYSGSTSDNWGYTATYDEDGYLYGGGIAFDDGYPVTIGAVQETYNGAGVGYIADITISKFTPDGTSLVYSTYLGGTSQDLPYSLIVNDDEELIIYGSTGSSNFPTVAGCYDLTFNGGSSITVDVVLNFPSGSDAFIAKLSADGSSLIGSTFFGGTSNDALNTGVIGYNYGDHARGEVITDDAGNIFIASSTRSPNLPVTAGAFQTTIGGAQDGFIAKFNPGLTTLSWSSFIGGTAEDGAYSIKKMHGPKFVVSGGTASSNMPTTPGALHEDYNGGSADGYLMIIPDDASDITHLTYIGTNAYDQSFLTEVDEDNHIYVTGQTRGDYPVVGDVYSNPGSSQYISKLDSTLSTLLLSTVFGSGDDVVNISPTAFLVDVCDNIFVAGWGGNVNIGYNFETGTVNDMPVTADAFQSTTDGSDFYLIVFSEDLADLSYATYFGGAISDEHVDGGTSRFDKSGVVYHAVCAGCGGSDDFPTTEGVVSNTNNAPNCNLGVFKFALAVPPTNALFILDPNSGCYPVDVNFTNLSTNAVSYVWDFGDGSTSTETDPSHTYGDPGVYTVTLVAEVDGICGVNDTTEATVTVFDYPVANYTFTPYPANVFQPVVFTDASIDAVEWLWEFGDGFTSTDQNPNHVYADTGSYIVCLTVTNADGCENKICDTILIAAISLLEVPNAFSPNDDGVNDVFLPLNYGLLNYEFRIYNRWGELIFLTNDPAKGWDGVYNGVEQELDVYVYVVSGDGEDGVRYLKRGNFTLVR